MEIKQLSRLSENKFYSGLNEENKKLLSSLIENHSDIKPTLTHSYEELEKYLISLYDLSEIDTSHDASKNFIAQLLTLYNLDVSLFGSFYIDKKMMKQYQELFKKIFNSLDAIISENEIPIKFRGYYIRPSKKNQPLLDEDIINWKKGIGLSTFENLSKTNLILPDGYLLFDEISGEIEGCGVGGKALYYKSIQYLGINQFDIDNCTIKYIRYLLMLEESNY